MMRTGYVKGGETSYSPGSGGKAGYPIGNQRQRASVDPRFL